MASKNDISKGETAKAEIAETAPAVTQEPGTAARARDEFGFELDEHGLPIAGPERAKRLGAAGLPDPLIDPDGFARGMKEIKNA